jgi:dUTP pyrophosphatase
MTAVLPKSEIKYLIGQTPPLIEQYINLEEQLQPNGFDMTLREVAKLESPGNIAVDNSQRIISGLEPLPFGKSDSLELKPDAYLVTFNEIVHLPNNIMALAKPRSSLLRCGVAIHNAVWDAGYSGRSQALLVVYNPKGFRVQKNARVDQLVFFRLSGTTEGYRGKYQNENI